jgi:hypothetical protein
MFVRTSREDPMTQLLPPFLQNVAQAGEPWRSGVEAWWKSVEDGRRALERIGDAMQQAKDRATGARPAAEVADLSRLVEALSLLEERQRQDRAEAELRISTLEQQVEGLRSELLILAETLAALTAGKGESS